MNIATFIITFGCIWWLIFFMALPIGVTIDETPQKGHASSAPKNPNLWKKALVTTVIALVITLGFFALLDGGYLAFLVERKAL